MAVSDGDKQAPGLSEATPHTHCGSPCVYSCCPNSAPRKEKSVAPQLKVFLQPEHGGLFSV